MIRALLYSLTVATVAAFATTSSRVNNRAQIAMATGSDTMSKSVPFLLKPKNTAGLIVSYHLIKCFTLFYFIYYPSYFILKINS